LWQLKIARPKEPNAELENVVNGRNGIEHRVVIVIEICHTVNQVTNMVMVVNGALHAKAPLSANGRIVIPAAIREEMGFAPGDTLLMDVEDGVLRVESYRARIRRIQREFAKYAKPGILASDELIADRREEACREKEEFERDKEQAQLRNEGQIA
jgi:AbrB family looped-hinge helix DNA binding protein